MKKKHYLVLDTETATLPFANEICATAKEKRKICIAKPIVYDIGWVIMDRSGIIEKKQNFLVQETFFVPSIFNTAYYKEKRPVYMRKLQEKEIVTKNWNDIIPILLEDLRNCDLVCAYNAPFDFKKAIPFTENYIFHLYRNDYVKWEEYQKRKSKEIINGYNNSNNPEYLEPFFKLRGEKFPIADLWSLTCERLINNNAYKEFCLKNNLLTESGYYFKSSAESSYRYLMKKEGFIEEHTALDDSITEARILAKLLHKGKVEPEILAFPFRKLGYTYTYVVEGHSKYLTVVLKALKKNASNRAQKILEKLVKSS